jgi:hypothetical protein
MDLCRSALGREQTDCFDLRTFKSGHSIWGGIVVAWPKADVGSFDHQPPSPPW